MTGTSAGVAGLEGVSFGNADVLLKVITSVDWFGPINFCILDDEAAASGFTGRINGESSPESQLIGKAVQSSPELVAKPNPTTCISTDDAALFISRLVAELLLTQGPLGVLWFDVPQEFDSVRGQSVIDFARTIQPNIVINNRTGAKGDLDTPQQYVGGF